MAQAPAIELRGVTKRYPGVVANKDVELTVLPSEVHAIVGENGAGKSTLMKIIYGMVRPDEGTISINGQPAAFRSPKEAIDAGIGMVHQHFMLADNLTVLENVVLGSEPRSGLQIDFDAAANRIKELGETYGLRLNPEPEGRGAVGGGETAGRDHQGPLSGGEDPHPRRADGGSGAPGGRRALRFDT